MKSVKPGRGPSFMNGISLVLVAAFGVVWTVIALQIGGGMFALFGVIFVLIALVKAVFHFKNATGEKRSSLYEIAEHGEEPDPWNERFEQSRQTENWPKEQDESPSRSAFCPYCGNAVAGDFAYCNRCGKKLP